jgi:hypothetical protein
MHMQPDDIIAEAFVKLWERRMYMNSVKGMVTFIPLPETGVWLESTSQRTPTPALASTRKILFTESIDNSRLTQKKLYAD